MSRGKRCLFLQEPPYVHQNVSSYSMWCFLFSLKKIKKKNKEWDFIYGAQIPTKYFLFGVRIWLFFGSCLFASFSYNSSCLGEKYEQLLVSIIFNDIMEKDTQCAMSLDVFQPQTLFQFSKMESIVGQDC